VFKVFETNIANFFEARIGIRPFETAERRSGYFPSEFPAFPQRHFYFGLVLTILRWISGA